jgi:hypothetical protein
VPLEHLDVTHLQMLLLLLLVLGGASSWMS